MNYRRSFERFLGRCEYGKWSKDLCALRITFFVAVDHADGAANGFAAGRRLECNNALVRSVSGEIPCLLISKPKSFMTRAQTCVLVRLQRVRV